MMIIILFLAVVGIYSAAPPCVGIKCSPCDGVKCGDNAQCFEDGDKAVCYCKEGDPWIKCYNQSDCHCCGDPHCKTLDGTYYDYQGTCPYVYSKPCNDTLTSNLDLYYVVTAKNKPTYPTSPVSYVSEVEVLMYNQVLHVDEALQFTVNTFTVALPYYYPNQLNPKIVAELLGSQVYIRNKNYVQVYFSPGFLKMIIPQMEAYSGPNGLCGLCGDLNYRCSDDLKAKDGTRITRSPCAYPTSENMKVAKVLDTWITYVFGGWNREKKCSLAQSLSTSFPQCDATVINALCLPLKQAIDGVGPFAACKGMGSEALKMAYEGCAFDVCLIKEKDAKCIVFRDFVKSCQNKLKKVALPNWRAATQCPLVCPRGMQYNSCISSCQATCAQPVVPKRCDKPCFEGCECLNGTLLDTSTKPPSCVQPKACPCVDAQGSPHAKNGYWTHDNCTKRSVCTSTGTILTTTIKCGEHGRCVPGPDGKMDCVCDAGYKMSTNGQGCIPV